MWEGANWQFEVLPASLVEQELTQRDQFNNDDVALADALVREVIQNSMDAATGSSAVKLRFGIRTLRGNDANEFRSLFSNLRVHLEACGIEKSILDRDTIRILCIEDFNTKGLTGNPAALDNENFHNFWRRHGRSEKSGKQGGRWGLGKLVFSSSSKIRAFFGLTIRSNEAAPLVMGQAVLANHQVDGKRHVAHGFWFGDRGPDDIQLPVTDVRITNELGRLAGLARAGQPGLSIVIPFLNDDVSDRSIVHSVIRNYYFPVLANRIVVEVGDTIVTRETFHTVATAVAEDYQEQSIPIRFVESVSQRLSSDPNCIAETSLNSRELGEDSFSPDLRSNLRERYANGEILHVRVPVTLKPKSATDVESFIDLFLQHPPNNEKPFALFARGGITVPGETRYFAGAHSFGAMVASHEAAVTFLGDAENPAHTAWNGNAEKLIARWRSPGQTLRNIRYALKALDTMVSMRVEREDKDALLDFFSIDDPSSAGGGQRPQTPKPPNDIVGREKALLIQGRVGGFNLMPGPAASNWNLPKYVDVRVAYDMIGSNPFKRHSAYDFDFNNSELEVSSKNLTIATLRPNKLRLTIESPEFHLSVSGFDRNRDLVVDARVVS